MPVISSTWREDAHCQADGRRRVYEEHVGSDGRTYSADYLAEDGDNRKEIMEMRATIIGDEIDRQAREAELSAGYNVSWTPMEFAARINPAETRAMQVLAEIDDTANYYLTLFAVATDFRAGHPLLVAGLNYFASVGALTTARANELATGISSDV